MKFLYKIKAGDEKEHSMEAMSYKKMLKSLVIKFPNQIVNCFYNSVNFVFTSVHLNIFNSNLW